MRVRKLRLILGLAGVAVCVGGSAVLYARQQAAGSIMPGKFLIINKSAAESVPVTLTTTDPKFPTLAVAITTAPDAELGDRTLQRLAAIASQAPPRRAWEYNLIAAADADMVARLNTAGREGWELVSVLDSAKGSSFLLKRQGR